MDPALTPAGDLAPLIDVSVCRYQRPDGRVVLPPTERLDPVDEPSGTQEVLGQTAAIGATIVMAGFATASLEQYLDQLDALASVRAGV
jgi:hypothetical protein